MLTEKQVKSFLQLIENNANALLHESKAFADGEITVEMFQAAVEEIAGKFHLMVVDVTR
jgi:hypothetical protein